MCDVLRCVTVCVCVCVSVCVGVMCRGVLMVVRVVRVVRDGGVCGA